VDRGGIAPEGGEGVIHFEWPWLALLLPLPWLVRRLLAPAAHARDAALRVPVLSDFAPERAQAGRALNARAHWRIWLAALAWLLLVLSATRPEWLGDLVEVPVSGRDLMLAVDLSGSMQAEDFMLGGQPVDRLTATKSVAGKFIERRAGDRIGLILFGERAYLQAPLTFDRETVRTLLFESVIGLAGKATAIGDAIGLAVKRLRGRDSRNRVLILLTDGANTAGMVEPLEAAELAAREGLKIYTIGVGADEMLVREFFGMRRINPSADLDEDVLKAIASGTGGRYFRARDTQELEEIYRLLDELEPVEGEARRFRPRRALFHWPLAGAVLCAGGLALLGLRGGIR
jgi:Ca-activated chloride channel family protein